MAVMRSASDSTKRIEEAFGWIKTVAGQQKTKFLESDRVGWVFNFAAAAYDLVRLPKLLPLRPTDGEGIALARSSLADARSPRRIHGTTISSTSSSWRDLACFLQTAC